MIHRLCEEVKVMKYEVLAPVGSYREIEIVLNENPDAIYVGMKGVSSRPTRTDFTVEEIKKATDKCHANGIRLYVAINALIYEREFDELVEVLMDLDKYGVDSLIIADYGLIYALAGKLKYAQIHASTLLGVYNIETVRLLKNMGVQRIILYANLYLDEIIKITSTFPELDYELVAEGGTCFNDIRQCRLPHVISEHEHSLTCRNGCILFGKDNTMIKGKTLAEYPCRTAEVVGIFMAAGITSFKIEGRTVPAIERIQNIRDLKREIEKYENGLPLDSYLHYVSRLRRTVLK